jgi:Type I phosphodiesterase / nucleotide pyrophosphatase
MNAPPPAAGRLTPAAVLPRYGTASLADLMPSVLAALGVPGPDPLGLAARLHGVRRVAVLLVDGLGWHQLPAAAPHAPTLARLAADPAARELTAAFPSTTPTSLVTVGTGVPPGTHGVVGFFLNVPGSDQVLNHIEWADEPDPRQWQPVEPVFARAAAAGVTTAVVSRPEFYGSGLTVAAYRGAGYRGAAGVDAVAAEILAALNGPAPALVYGYHGTVDTVGHLFGVDSPEWRLAVADVDRLVRTLAEGLPRDAALLVTADHGQLNIPLEGRLDVDTDPRLRQGVAVVAGEPRVRYLHVLPGAQEDVMAAWRSVLGVAAWVGTREEAVAEGWFGPVAPEHLARIGDVVVVCQDHQVVLASASEPSKIGDLVAFHGSYTPVEMAVPLLVVRGG